MPVPEVPAVSLAELTTLRVGGMAERLVSVESTDALVDAVRECDDAEDPLLLVAGGSNLLVADDPVPGTVIKIASHGITVESQDDCAGISVRVAAGHPWDEFVSLAVDSDWVGIEALSGIPGSTGATPVQNVGAYGQEVAQTIASVRVWDRMHGRVHTIAAADCQFSYRDSAFKGIPYNGPSGQYVILDVLFQLRSGDLSLPIGYADVAAELGVNLGDRVPLRHARAAVLEQRAKRGMVLAAADHDTWSAGSFFTNPILSDAQWQDLDSRVKEFLGAEISPPRYVAPTGVKTSAAWLIDRAGFDRGFGLPGPAALSTKHTLAVTNRGSATAADIVALARQIQAGVSAAFGVTLHPEPLLVGITW